VANVDANRLLRQLPAVHTLLDTKTGLKLIEQYGRELVTEASARVLGLWREKILAGQYDSELAWPPASKDLLTEIQLQLNNIFTISHLRRVVNATGIILHTNLGRAVLGERALAALNEAAGFYTNLEYNLEKGERGSRHDHVEELLIRLSGAEAAMVVNNNAAAVLLVMNTLAMGKEVVVSRGELVEIGGSFRIPEVLKMGGVTLVEVGTTNRTHLGDYEKAVGIATGVILKVHASNFRIYGFVKSVQTDELVQLAHKSNVPLVEDLGSGSLVDLSAYGVKDETPVAHVLSSGVDVVTFSGDKLLGGPQAGIIVGKKEYIKAMKANQLSRALRVDKFTLAALEATLREYLRPEYVLKELPIYRMLITPLQELEEKAHKIAGDITAIQSRISATPVPTQAQMGGGSLPGQDIPSWGIVLESKKESAGEIESALRHNAVPIVGYIDKDRYTLDLRTLLPGDEEIIIKCIKDLIELDK